MFGNRSNKSKFGRYFPYRPTGVLRVLKSDMNQAFKALEEFILNIWLNKH